MTQVSEIEIVPVKPANGLVGFASCVLDNKLFLGSIAIYTRLSTEGYRCVYPTKKLPNGQQLQVYYPINKETSHVIEQAVSKKLDQLLTKTTFE
jgi:DNA-binding cell septation regulator SpoVG